LTVTQASQLVYAETLPRPTKLGDFIYFKVDTAELVGLSQALVVTLSNGQPTSSVVAYTAATSIGTTYWVAASSSSYADGTVTVSVTAPDTAGNAWVAVVNAQTGRVSVMTYVKDRVAPSVALTYSIASSVPANAAAAAALTYSASASRPVKVGDVMVVKAITTEATGLASALSLSLSGGRTITPLAAYTAVTSIGTTYWTHTVASGADGTVTVSSSTTDTATNTAVMSGTATFIVDTTAPTAATGLVFAAIGGTVVTNVLNNTNTNFRVTATVTGNVGSAGGTAELLVGGASFSTPVTASVANGAISVTLTASFTTNTQVKAAMASGARVLTVKLTDSAGNTVTSSATVTVTANYAAPQVTLAYATWYGLSPGPTLTQCQALTYNSPPLRGIRANEYMVVRAVTTVTNALSSALVLTLSGSRTITPMATYTTSTSVGTTYWKNEGVYPGALITISLAGPDTAGNAPESSSTMSYIYDPDYVYVTPTYSIASSVPSSVTAAAALTYTSSASRSVKLGDVLVVKATTAASMGMKTALVLTLSGSRTITPMATYTNVTSVGVTYWTHTVGGAASNGVVTLSATGLTYSDNPALVLGTNTFTIAN